LETGIAVSMYLRGLKLAIPTMVGFGSSMPP